MNRRRVLILGAAGRDFHNFNVVFREDPTHDVVGFTATQIPRIAGRQYPAALAGPHHPKGIPIYPEANLEHLIRDLEVEEAVFSYSDVSYEYIGHLCARVNAAGADFRLMGTRRTMLPASVPVVAVTAVRTGSGKSQTSRYVARHLRAAGCRVVVVRHPMPYGDLERQAVQRLASLDDLTHHDCTFEEREEYETHIEQGSVVYAGVDYAAILEKASAECDVLVWDGGNNDWPFYVPDLWITVADPLRAGHETRYYPGEVNFRSADVIVINKVESADPGSVEAVESEVARVNPKARVIRTRSLVSVPNPEVVRGQRVLCIEDGPTLTHGEMAFGAALVAAQRFGAAEVVDPRPYAVRSIRDTLDKYRHIGKLLPATGYWPEQIADLEESIDAAVRGTKCDLVLVGTPFDLASQLHIEKPALRVRYVLEPMEEEPSLPEIVASVVKR